jgi:hypothetical protein
MPKKKVRLADAEWEPHDKASYLKDLGREQAPGSASWQGERFAMAVNCKTKSELCAMMEKSGREIGVDLVEFIISAQDSLKMRLDLVNCAFARLASIAMKIKADEASEA